MQPEEPRKEHQWLKRLVGEWTYQFEASPGPDKPPEIVKGTETVRALGELWVLIEARGESSSAGQHSQITIGFDPAQGKFVGSFVSSAMSRMWIYEGALEAEDSRLVLKSVGPSMAQEGQLASYEDIVEVISDNERSFASRMQQPDGSWVEFMRGNYRRTDAPSRPTGRSAPVDRASVQGRH